MNNIFVSTTFVPDGSPLRDALELCSGTAIQSIEIGSNHCFEKNYNYLLDYDFQYLIHNYFPIPKKSFVLNIASLSDETRAMSIKHIKKAIDYCNLINAKLYTFHPGFLTDPKGTNLSVENYDFQWDNKKLIKSNSESARQNMYTSLDVIIEYATKIGISIAIETEGSLHKKEHLLMQRPSEYTEFMQKYRNTDIGINLNIGHLNLASKAFNFGRKEFVDHIQNYIVAMELSHNDGKEDEHLPLKPNLWYWDIIHNERFKEAYKILEFRNTPIDRIRDSINLFSNNNDI